MQRQQMQQPEQLLEGVRIFVDNDSIAYFDAPNPPCEPTDVKKIISLA